MAENIENNLILKAKQGDHTAIADLFNLYWRAARASAFGVTGDIDLAEDAASEALYTALTNIHDLQEEGKFGPWLHTIVIRAAQHIKHSKHNTKLKILPEKTLSKGISDLEQREFAVLIREAAGGLQDILREAISLYYFEGYNVEQIAVFLDIPVGTVKRRLHDGRKVLHDSAEKIIKGIKPMNNKREQILKKLNDFLEKGGDSDDFRKIMRQAMTLRPVPYELLGKIMSKHSPIAKKLAEPGNREKYALHATKVMDIMAEPSQRIIDSNHPVGKVMIAIKSALPEFKERRIDKSKLAEHIVKVHTGQLDSSDMPPGCAEGIPGSFISFSKQLFFEKKDGSLCTMYELDGPISNAYFRRNGLISDALHLIWLRTETIELHSIEEFLRELSEHIAPDMKLIFSPYNEPRFCSALRMHFENVTIPAATGGVCISWPGIPDGVSVASVQLYLEAWASVQSGQFFELEQIGPFLEKMHNIHPDESQAI